MVALSKYIKPSVMAMKPYSSARDEYHGDAKVFLDANENPDPFDYARYPDPYQKELKSRLASLRSVSADQLFIGNGSDEVIDLLIRATCRQGLDRILTLDPSYGMYTVSAAVNEIEIDLVAMDEDLDVDEISLFSTLNNQHKLIFICSPNNPNGAIVDPALIKRVLDVASGLVIVDEAYIDFADTDSWVTMLGEYSNLVVLQTMSKAFGCAGLRIGVGIMDSDLVQILNKIKPPYNISTANQDAALLRLENLDDVKRSIDAIRQERARIELLLLEMDIVDRIFPSQANFLLVRFQNSRKVLAQLLAEGIVVRDRSTHTHCNDCIRISIGTRMENELLIDCLSQC